MNQSVFYVSKKLDGWSVRFMQPVPGLKVFTPFRTSLTRTTECLRFCSGKFGRSHLVNHLIHKLTYPQMAFIFKYYFIAQWECIVPHDSQCLMQEIIRIMNCKKKYFGFKALDTSLRCCFLSHGVMNL